MKVNGDGPVPTKRVWPADSQTWCVNKRGVIYPAAFPQLCLTMSDDQPIARKVTPDVVDFKVCVIQLNISIYLYTYL